MAYQQRGLNEENERLHAQIIRDTRTLGQRFTDVLKNPRYNAVCLIGSCAVLFLAPAYFDFCFVVAFWIFLYCYFQKAFLPFRVPMRSHQKDYGDVIPGTKTARSAQGIYFFGNQKIDDKELWFSNEDMRTHMLIFGSTGSGKTEALISLAYNALLQSSGFIYVDGKGDNSLYSKIFAMTRSMGREDDLLLINFMTGARDIIGPQERRLSNTMNPFSTGSSSMLAQLIVSLMPSASKGSSDGDMWKGRAIGFVEALMRILVTMRDMNYILLDAHTIRQYFLLPKLEAMVVDRLFLREGAEAINLENLPRTILEPIENYVYNLPGYNKEKKGNQVSQVLEQHGYITMQLTRVFTSLADTYAHIMRTDLAEVDFKDVVLNRRILCVLLPALEKSPDELSNLGKIIIASLKAMMASGLGENVEGEVATIIESKPTNSKSPYLCILDEYGYYAVEGFAVVPAQARSLGFSVIFAGQDLPAFQKASKEEAASIGANTNIKVCMKLEDPVETWDFFMKSAGESYVSHVESFQVDTGSLWGMYQDNRGARMEKRSRIDLLDLKEQLPGEAHFLFKSKIVRGRFFRANPKIPNFVRLNHFIKIKTPSDETVEKLMNSFSEINQLREKNFSNLLDVKGKNEEIDEILSVLPTIQAWSVMDQAALLLEHFYLKDQMPFFWDDDLIIEQEPIDLNCINLFTPLKESYSMNHVLLAPNKDLFSKSILNRADSLDQLEYIQRLCGQSRSDASNSALALIQDIENKTQYPPSDQPNQTATELAQVVQDLIQQIELKKTEKQDD